ncbi:hypothetical protein TREPR_0167 [Treponema primitia ZAS-2]|uniref:Pyridoxamine 5'-phosphate oxidase putative domain-containing protein n=1 Tax=Treponema primitia (strain ATCC BAA-887 / DSM 12427 / ZAS-2) TaxID=545694 RepID=F5YMF5_TREPZ|nr:pyridoxamine 5'-phosphate oxidase family protein [Treponema primitia]AEF86096.1 hypothetical protein TREPR_0167 [Treponema primitia ZAS-2]
MSILTREIIDLIQSDKSIKIIATTDEQGSPHAVAREDFLVLDDGLIVFAEWRESSRTNSNLVRAIYFGNYVSLSVFNDRGHSFQIKVKPVRFDFYSPLFKQFFAAIRKKRGDDSDITGLWYLAPVDIRNENPEIRKKEEDVLHPHFRYLDRSSIRPGVNSL